MKSARACVARSVTFAASICGASNWSPALLHGRRILGKACAFGTQTRRFIDAYDWIFSYEPITGDERAVVRALHSQNHADRLTIGGWSNIREACEHAIAAHGINASIALQWQIPFDALAGEARKVSVGHTPPFQAFCTPMLTREKL